MDTSKAKKTAKKGSDPAGSGKREPIKIESFDIKNVRVVEGRKGDIVFFTLEINGVVIYNCRVATGKDGDFISFPQYKGTDGNYYNNVYVAISDEDSKVLLETIQNTINDQ